MSPFKRRLACSVELLEIFVVVSGVGHRGQSDIEAKARHTSIIDQTVMSDRTDSLEMSKGSSATLLRIDIAFERKGSYL